MSEERVEFLLKAVRLARERWREHARAALEGGRAERGVRLAEGSLEAVARFSLLEVEVAVADWRLEKPCLYLRERLIREEPEPLALVERVLRWLKGEGEDPSLFRELAGDLEGLKPLSGAPLGEGGPGGGELKEGGPGRGGRAWAARGC